MSEPEKSVQEFLRRWSRRKLGEADHGREAADADGAEPAAPADAVPEAPDAAVPAFDPASLPPIESINAASDLRAFLAPGVPLELARAALRRAWVSDPNIRDFVGIAENQWDFTKPDGVPGFGPLELTAELHRMVAELNSARPSKDPTVTPENSRKTAMPDPAAFSTPDSAAASPVVAEPAVTQIVEKNAATQNDFASDEPIEPPVPPKHGGALPK